MSFRSSVLFCGIVLSASCICALPVPDDDNSGSDHVVAVLDLEGRLNGDATASEHAGEHFFCWGSSYLKSKTCSASVTALNVHAGTTFQCKNDYLCTPPSHSYGRKRCSDLATKVEQRYKAKVNDHSLTFQCSGHIAAGGRWYCLRLMPSSLADCNTKLGAFNIAVRGLINQGGLPTPARQIPTPSPTAQKTGEPSLPTPEPGTCSYVGPFNRKYGMGRGDEPNARRDCAGNGAPCWVTRHTTPSLPVDGEHGRNSVTRAAQCKEFCDTTANCACVVEADLSICWLRTANYCSSNEGELQNWGGMVTFTKVDTSCTIPTSPSPTPSPTAQPTLPTQLPGTNCWNQCNRQSGPCAWCGAGGRCCRNSGMFREEAGCEGFNRGYNHFAHKCSF